MSSGVRLTALTRRRVRLFITGLFCGLFVSTAPRVAAQVPTFAGNAQHTSVYGAPAQNLNTIKWSTTIDFHPTTVAHYGSPLVTANNTVLVPVKTASDGFRVDAFNGNNGAAKYVINTDYILPVHNWIPVYNPCIATGPFGTRMYYAGAGGTILHIDNPDSNSPGPPVREVFYTSPANYSANAAAYNNTIFINTPLTADAAGNIYFGFRVQGTAPAPLNTNQSGIARIDANGNGIYVFAGAVANDASISRVSHNVAPALSSDGSTVYIAVKWSTNNSYAYLLGLNSATLERKYSVFLRDPRNSNPASVPEDGTASPMIAPDGDVYFGVLAANTGSRGFLLRFSGDLTVTKTPGAFGWDYTPGIIPASLVPSYTGSSPYLLFSKYNDYPSADASGVNRVALLDPNAFQIDPHSSANGLLEMREVLTVIGPTPDTGVNPSTFPWAVREWCINAPAVNPATGSVYFTSEDGRSYRWNLTTNTLDQAVVLTPGVLEPYVPTVIGPDGTVYTLNGGTLFALGSPAGTSVTINSSAPDLRSVVVGTTITFTATVTGTPTSPTGTVTFTDFTYNGTTPVTTTLASNVPLNANGVASVTTSSLTAGGGFRGSHFITAAYSGDGGHPASSVTMVQKVHANATTLVLNSSQSPTNFGQAVTFTATVSSVPSNGGTPTGMVTLQDGATAIGQASLNSSGVVTFTSTSLVPGNHDLVATYASDTQFAASTANLAQVIQSGTSTVVTSSANPSSFGQSIVIDAIVTANGAPGIPSGSVTFREGATVLATVSLNSGGHATFSTSTFNIGSHTVTADFAGTNGWLASSGQVVQVVQDAPLLLLEENSQRAIALDLVVQTRDPFSLTNPNNLSSDLRRRISLFVWRLGLQPGDTASALTVLAEDDQGGSYPLVAEQMFPVAGVQDVTQVVVRLPESVAGTPRDLKIKVKAHGLFSNQGVIRISGN
jgi:Bacterial Ig-like domain (group 3)